MNLKNKSQRVICIDEKRIIPGKTTVVDDSNKKNAIVAALIKAGDLVELKEDVKTEERASAADFDALLETNPNYKQLQAFARRNNIDVGDAKGVEELTAVIKAALSL